MYSPASQRGNAELLSPQTALNIDIQAFNSPLKVDEPLRMKYRNNHGSLEMRMDPGSLADSKDDDI